MEMNEVLDRLPGHLLSLVIEQPYNEYTAQDHAVWRYIMRQNVSFLPNVAHPSYLDGLRRTGISIDRIPHMYGMNRILKEIGWAAVAVDGFIPPAAFMEFQAYNVLVIAADIRPVNQIQYTPAPDIIHEAAGHAPIIADPMYASYLRNFGKLGSMAFSSPFDDHIYEAIRHLSILKADPYSSASSIEEAEEDLERLMPTADSQSEMALLRNLHWWTVEYGLIGDPDQPRIYGAGLLSSIGESYNCLQPAVKKIPYSIDARLTSFDITTQQPQLFVTPDFEYLNTVLDEYATSMAVRNGGLPGIRKAVKSESLSTIVYSSGVQVSGLLSGYLEYDDKPSYVSFNGPVILAKSGKVIPGHGIDYHSTGFGSPVGLLKGISTPPELMTESELQSLGISAEKQVELRFESGIEVQGVLRSIVHQEGRNLVFTFTGCTVRSGDKVLFNPQWGTYDMVVGSEITSCFSGVADPEAYKFEFPVPREKTHKLIHSPATKKLHSFYQTVASMRENTPEPVILKSMLDELRTSYPEDWLLALEMQELVEPYPEHAKLREDILRYLKVKAIQDGSLLKLIQDGLALEKSESMTNSAVMMEYSRQSTIRHSDHQASEDGFLQKNEIKN